LSIVNRQIECAIGNPQLRAVIQRIATSVGSHSNMLVTDRRICCGPAIVRRRSGPNRRATPSEIDTQVPKPRIRRQLVQTNRYRPSGGAESETIGLLDRARSTDCHSCGLNVSRVSPGSCGIGIVCSTDRTDQFVCPFSFVAPK
jgi:hypothetical protein